MRLRSERRPANAIEAAKQCDVSRAFAFHPFIRGGGILLIEILSARIARESIVCLISIRQQARKARIEKNELDEGFQPYHPPFRIYPSICLPARARTRPSARALVHPLEINEGSSS